jgi:integrase
VAKIRFDSLRKKYFLDWHEDGVRYRVFTGTEEKHANRELEKLKARLLMKKMGFTGSPSPKTTNLELSSKTNVPPLEIDTAIEKYLEYSKLHHSPMNYQCNSYILKGPFLSFIKRKNIKFLNQVTLEVIENYKALRLKGELKIKKIKPITLNRQLNTLKPMFKKFVEWEYLRSNPFDKVSPVRYVEEETGKCLSNAECQQLLEASRKCNGGDFYYLIATALGTGMRKSELKNLMVSDVNLEKSEINIRNRGQEARTKTGKNRVVDLSDNLVQILSKYNAENDYMFDFTNFRRNWDKTKKISGVKCRFHDLRHTFITRCLENGIQPVSVADWVGHADLRMIMKIYKHLRRHHLKREINKLNNLYKADNLGSYTQS